jgi:MarR family transcriptional regulator, 2-MHQ and catechol-resistance regulon repressor
MSTDARVEAPGLWIVLMRCHRALSKIAERSIQGTGLSLTDFATLEALLHKGPQTITEIQSRVPLASGSMTAAVDRLEERGFIRRTSAPGDRRAKVLKLTPAGKRVAETSYGRHAAELESVMSVLSPTERHELRASLKKLGLFAAGVGAKADSGVRAPNKGRDDEQ